MCTLEICICWETTIRNLGARVLRLSENAYLPFDKLMALSKVVGPRYPHPSSLRRTSMYAHSSGFSPAGVCGMDIFHQPLRNGFFDSLVSVLPLTEGMGSYA